MTTTPGRWRVDTPGAAEENRREVGTEAEAMALAAGLKPPVCVWEMGPVGEKGATRAATGSPAAQQGESVYEDVRGLERLSGPEMGIA